MDQRLKAFIIQALRRATYKWHARTEALKDARIERGLYKCNSCKGEFKRKEVQVDHIQPVISIVTGFTTWDDYINRMFPSKEGFQIICIQCHDNKTELEKKMRKHFKKTLDKKTKKAENI